MKKKLFAMILCLAMILSFASILSEVSFAEGEKTFTVTKRVVDSTEVGTEVGSYDTLFDAFGACQQLDQSNEYVITVNKDYDIPADESVWSRQDVNIILKSAEGKKCTLKRLGTRLTFYVAHNCKMQVENIILDGNNDGELTFISENGELTLGKGTVVQNFIDVPSYDGPAIHMTGGTLNVEDGAIIQNNNSNTQGGVIQAYKGTTVNISGGTFKNNKSNTSDGGAIAALGTLNITGGIFENNEAKKTSGAIFIGRNNSASISNATFKNNKASTGGAIYSSKEFSVSNTTFENNEAKWGGAVFASKKLTLNDSIFKNNKVTSAGGALYLQGEADIKKSTFIENTASSDGGAVYSVDADIDIDNCTFEKNDSKARGGALLLGVQNNPTVNYTIKNSTIKNNKSKNIGGGITAILGTLTVENSTIEANNSDLLGGGIVSVAQTIVNLNKCRIKNNTANGAAGIFVGTGGSQINGTVNIKGTEFNGNDTGSKKAQKALAGGGIYIDEGITVNISDSSKFIDNKAGFGGAIYNVSSDYKNPADETKYKNLNIDKTTLFKGNEARLGLFPPPSNYDKFTNLAFDDKSDTPYSKYMSKSLLNNYDINYMGGLLIVYDANEGKFADGTDKKFEVHKENDEITIIDAPTRDGYTFLYWKGSEYNPGDKYIVKENHTFIAQWKAKKPTTTHILTLDENHAHGKITDYDVMKGEAIDPYLYIPRRKGYIFRGWSYNRDFLDEVRKGDIVYGDTVLYAIWKKDKAKDEAEEPEEIKGQEHKAYIFGYPDGTVRPNGEITRAEAAAMLARLLEIESIGSAEAPSFPDTPSAWYNKAINAVVQRGIMKGYPDGTFKPNDAITRAEFTQMISTIDNKPYGTAPFADVVGHWAERPIGSEYQAGRIAGYPDGTFRPDAHITRCEAAVILNKIFERNFDAMSLLKCKNPQMIKYFIDLDASFWGYNDMVEATNTHEYVRRVTNRVEENWLLIK